MASMLASLLWLYPPSGGLVHDSIKIKMSQFLTGRISHALGDTLVARGKEENRGLPAAPSQVCSIVFDGDGQISQYKYQAILPLCRMSTLCGNLSITSSAIQLLAKVSYLPHFENCQYTTVYNCCKYSTYNAVRADLTCQRLYLALLHQNKPSNGTRNPSSFLARTTVL